jgi:hypothetical protein
VDSRRPPKANLCIAQCSVQSRCYATTAKWADIPGPFLGTGSVNTFRLLGSGFLIILQLDYNNGRAVFSTWSVPRSYKRDEVPSLVDGSVLESMRTGLESEAEE